MKRLLLLIFISAAGLSQLRAQLFPDSNTCISNTFNLDIDNWKSTITACGPVTLSTTFKGKPDVYWSNGASGSQAIIYETGYFQAFAKDSAGCFDTSRKVYVEIQSSTPWAYSNNFMTAFCSGNSLTLSVVSKYPGKWNTGDSTLELTVSNGGKYFYISRSDSGCTDTSNVMVIEEVKVQKPKLTVRGNKTICRQDSTFIKTSSSHNISWYPFGYGDSIRVSVSGLHYAIATEKTYGCTANSDSVVITINDPFTETLCMVTNDSSSGYNMLMWNKTPGKRTVEYKIFREGNITGSFDLIGTVPFSSSPRFTDSSSTPRQRSYTYYIQAIDSCGNGSDESVYYTHSTVHLTANLGVSGENNLNWTDYMGIYPVTGYAIYRQNNGGNFIEIDRVASSKKSYSDLNPPSGTNRYYIGVVADVNCSSVKGKVTFRSNQVQFGTLSTTDMVASGFSLYPNPASDLVSIYVPVACEIEISDAAGRSIRKINVMPGTTAISTSMLIPGIYLVKAGSETAKMVISR